VGFAMVFFFLKLVQVKFGIILPKSSNKKSSK